MNPEHLKLAEEECQQLLDQGLIEASDSLHQLRTAWGFGQKVVEGSPVLCRLQHFHALCVSTPYRVLKYVTVDS
ncbi:hypothetical protein V6Z11_D04G088100 [Gossypium hirsutum]